MSQDNPWIIRARRLSRARLKLLCFPYAGGGASLFRDWPQYLPSDVELIAVQLPGRETRMREPAFTAMSDLLPALTMALSDELENEFVLFGHSMGALIAYELACRLYSEGRRMPARLVVSGCQAPHLQRIRKPLHGLKQNEFVAELRRLRGTPDEILINDELMELLSPRLRADFSLCETRRHLDSPCLPCPISLFAGIDDEYGMEQMKAWQMHCRTPLDIKWFPGGHFFVHQQKAAVLSQLSARLLPLASCVPRKVIGNATH